jgi:hypothetical protein
MEIEKETCRTSLTTLRFLSYIRRTSKKNVASYDPLLAILPQEAGGLRKQSYLTGREHVVVTMLTRRSGEWLDIRLARDHGYPKPTTHLPFTSYAISKTESSSLPTHVVYGFHKMHADVVMEARNVNIL